jgi:outer membrane protein assembly factor BamB
MVLPARFQPGFPIRCLGEEFAGMSRISFGVGVALILSAGLALAAEPSRTDWPQFRGPNRDDISPDKGLLKRWPREGPPVLWKATGVGSGYSSVAISAGRLYTLGNKDNTTYVFAVNLKNGKVLWSAKVGPAGGDLGCTPTVDEDRVYAIGQDGDLVCVESGSGEVRWHKHLRNDFKGACGGWHYTESPLIDGEKLVCTPGARDATLIALDKKTGAVIWKSAVPVGNPTAGYSSIVVSEAGGIRQYVQLLAAGVVGVAAEDGRFLWWYDSFNGNTANIPTPIVLGDRIFSSTGYGRGGSLLQLKAVGDKVTVKELYHKDALTNKHGGVVLVGDYVYGDTDDSGSPFCAEVKTGKVRWKKEQGPGHGSAAVTYADGRLYFRYENGVMSLVDPSPRAYHEISSFRVANRDSRSWAHPVVVGGRMYLRCDDVVWCFDVKQH